MIQKANKMIRKANKKMEEEDNLYIDSEWSSQDQLLSLTIQHNRNLYFYYNKDYPCLVHVLNDYNINRFFQEKNYQLTVVPWDCNANVSSQETTIFYDFLQREPQLEKCINIHFFYSLRDVEYLFSKEIYQIACHKFLKNSQQEFLIQKRVVYGFYKFQEKEIHFFDKFGWVNKGGLKSLISILGIKDHYKTILDENKACMEKSLRNEKDTLDFINYSINDVVCLSQTDTSMCHLINIILDDVGLSNFQFSPKNIPSTYGALVAKIVEEYIQDYFDQFGLKERFLETNLDVGVDKEYRLKKQNQFSKYHRSKKNTISNLIGGASIPSLAHLHRNGSGILSAIIQGGRTFNERWWEWTLENTFDIDFSGCYGSALTKFDIVIGLPTVISFTSEQKPITLRQFFKKYGHELIDNKYTITISGTLNFNQTLLYSKIITPSKMHRKINQIMEDIQFENPEEFSGDFVILERELMNAILTSDIFHALQRICTSQEFDSILNCYVNSAVFYKKSDLQTNPKKFLECFTYSSKKYGYNPRTQSILDLRSRAWLAIPLHGFIQPLQDLRKEKKKLMKTSLDPEEVKKLDGLQNMIKTIVNTTYGVFASAFFAIGSVVLANNITARARLAVWMSSRCLYGTQSITDGHQYQPGYIFELKNEVKRNGKKPGLETLSDLRKLSKHRSISKTTLGNLNWNDLFDGKKTIQDYPSIDSLAEEHLTKFWDFYDIKIPYSVEHKMENVSKKTFFIKKAHYANYTIFNKVVYKIRGVPDKQYSIEKPIYHRIANAVLFNQKLDPLESLVTTEERLTRLSDYLASISKYGKENPNLIKYPGYKDYVEKTFRLTNMDFPYINKKDFDMRVKNEKDYAPFFLDPNFDYHRIFEFRITDYENLRNSFMDK